MQIYEIRSHKEIEELFGEPYTRTKAANRHKRRELARVMNPVAKHVLNWNPQGNRPLKGQNRG